MKKLPYILIVLAAAAGLAFIGYRYRGAILPLLGSVPGASRVAGKLGIHLDRRPQGEDILPEDVQREQERIVRSLSEQQIAGQAAHQATMQSIAETQRALKSIEEINRMNRTAQQLQQQQKGVKK